MKSVLGHFKCVILSPRKLIYDKEIQSLFVIGDTGEYEILPYHYPVLGVIKKSDIIINWEEKIPVNGGVLRFYANECIIMIEESVRSKDFALEK
jgi:F0F1-type ATP synthase epsilon subunit